MLIFPHGLPIKEVLLEHRDNYAQQSPKGNELTEFSVLFAFVCELLHPVNGFR
jgi:hypothetical protein